MRKASSVSRRESSELVALKEFVRELKAENLRLQKQVAQEKAKRVTAENKARRSVEYDRVGADGVTEVDVVEVMKAGS